ncbi:signal recognition particle-docking protein FtsY [Helicobacter kayseriensis]|uniref:signal recognition particle-docking protein FtsY n=1 Tax=Helicobacter kayseriensis TaxID=2905877 RepID=UPI001E2E24A1|nr:signal recognition particle-docking protein FtsY [Helicobacter kayseriensis]MCE3046568.1 signal recognition particle-docking protein FtsY [Helicobacter kayseriensis]MCE3048130.1 signal recognition particle-docking protein FtsY [Helicobacter kayseriensis]
MFQSLKSILKKTTDGISQAIGTKKKLISQNELENALIESDISYDLIEMMLKNLPQEVSKNELEVALWRFFRAESYYDKLQYTPLQDKPEVMLIIGVNGAGKTTTIAKLAHLAKKQGKKVILGAGDTFRAAAIEQLKLWGEKLGIEVISSQIGHDPSSIAFDSIKAGLARGADQIIIDTAGRLHNQTNLKNELIKISKVCSKALDEKPFHKLLILDGTQGSSAITQAKIFNEILNVDGIIVTKLDSTSKGGAILSMIYELKLPIAYIGTGEKEDNLLPFNEEEYIQSILEAIFG